MYTYTTRLNQLKLPSLELRRLRIDLIMCYKVVFGLVDVNYDDFFSAKHCCDNKRLPI